MALEYERSILALDFDRLTPGGLLYDHSPHALHMTFGAGAAAPTRNINGGYDFDGGDEFYMDATAMARFYAVAPTRQYTFAGVINLGATAAGVTRAVFDASVVAPRRGIALRWNVAGVLDAYQNNEFGFSAVQIVPGGATGRRWAFVITVQTTPTAMLEDQRIAAAWVVGAFGTCVYDAAAVPRIGAGASGSPFIGNMRYFLLYDGALTEDDQRELMTHMVEGRAPFCVRR